MSIINYCSRCLRANTRPASVAELLPRAGSVRCKSTAPPQPEPIQIYEEEHEFTDVLGELHRRKKKMDQRRNRGGGDFVDFLRVTVRGGKGGAGTSAFLPMKRGLGPASGGNGGPGGSVYLKTSTHLTSLSSVAKRLIGEQGGNGAGNLRHGGRGGDVIVTVPVGTVIREIRREGEAEKFKNECDALGLERDERRQRARDRWLVHHPNMEASDLDIREAEQLLRKSGRWMQSTPGFDKLPPLELDISEPLPEPVLLARGGAGGLGNPHFVSSNIRHPRLASRGVQPPTRTFEFELKLLADVGLVGLPNAGKSTLLRAMTGRRAEVADYAFTTLHPQIGVVRLLQEGGWAAAVSQPIEDTELEREADANARDKGEYTPLPRASRKRQAPERTRFTVSDNPGLLAGASENVGLGHSFLRSIERSLALAYVLDARKANPADDLHTLREELEAYKPGLASRVRAVVLNKADEMLEEELEERIAGLKSAVKELDDGEPEILVVSAKFGTGMERLVNLLADAVDAARPPKPQSPKVKVKEKRPEPEPLPEEPPEKVEELF